MTEYSINFEAYCADNRIHELPGIQPCEQQDPDSDSEDYNHTVIFTAPKRFIRDFETWTRLVAQDAWEVGGDDTYYDYYPGNFDAARAIAKAVPETRAAVRFMEDFAIAVRYGVAGILDGLGITNDEDEAIRRWSSIMGQKLFVNAHAVADDMAALGGFWMNNHSTTAKWKKIDSALARNRHAKLMGLSKDLLPYSEKWLDYFRTHPKM